MNRYLYELAFHYIDRYGETAFKEALTPPKKKSTKIWPTDYKWWQENKELQAQAKKYKILLPLLTELRVIKAIHQDKNRLYGIEPFTRGDEKREYVLLDLSRQLAALAQRLGCNEKTLGNYIRGLCDCGLMRSFPRGRRTFYAIGEWGIMPSDEDQSEFVPRKILWLTEATSGKLLKFKPR